MNKLIKIGIAAILVLLAMGLLKVEKPSGSDLLAKKVRHYVKEDAC